MNDQAQPQQLVIPLATAEAVVNYLAQRPYIEVFQLMAAMQQLQPLPVPATPVVPAPLGVPTAKDWFMDEQAAPAPVKE